MDAKGVTPILNVSDIAASFAWFEKWGWRKCWDWGTPPTFGFFAREAKRGVEIARLLFVVDKIPKHERDRVRRDLLDYCHRDALAMVRLVETLEGLARVAP